MSRLHRRLRALAFLLLLFPLWWLQRTHANPMAAERSSQGESPAKPVQPGGDDGAPHTEDQDDGDDDDSDDGDDDDGDKDDGDDDDGDDDDGDDDDGDDDDGDDDDGDDDDGGGGGNDCNSNGVDDALDIEHGTSFDSNRNSIPDECESFIKEGCIGSGSENGGVDCPCGNTVPPGETSGCKNSTGQGASLTATGNPLVSNDTLVLTATGIPVGKVSFFLFGAVNEPSGHTFGDGTRCIGSPFSRVRKVSNSTGNDTFPAPNTLPISQQLGITPGQLTVWQVIYRDGAGPCHNGANATNALVILWGP